MIHTFMIEAAEDLRNRGGQLYDRLLISIAEHLYDEVQRESSSFNSDDHLLEHISRSERRFLATGKYMAGFTRYLSRHWIKWELLEARRVHAVHAVYDVYDLHEVLFRHIYISMVEKRTRLTVIATLKKTPRGVGHELAPTTAKP
ncbi:hypothetical protein B0I35DRAFT_464882 [Stachybotrys elegans]|uniref:Uncharacterized protein n=1 Tax=Stachybotrys elegans TaxID=80388 RepID=A0A8K0WKU2_9HYPO|nr:hypothetical protein B0I35DRAFT_464882 [Stachybotrys elegans]